MIEGGSNFNDQEFGHTEGPLGEAVLLGK